MGLVEPEYLFSTVQFSFSKLKQIQNGGNNPIDIIVKSNILF